VRKSSQVANIIAYFTYSNHGVDIHEFLCSVSMNKTEQFFYLLTLN